MQYSVAFLLLTKNEQASIGEVILDLQQACNAANIQDYKIVLADDSSDQTRAIAKSMGCEIVDGGGVGLGRAYTRGLKYCATLGADFVVSLDADGQTDLTEIKKFLQPVILDQADLVTASRFLNKEFVDYNYRWINRLGVFFLAKYLSWMTGQTFSDSHGGIRAMRRCVAESLEIMGVWTYVQESIVDAHSKGFRILEIPSRWLPRKSGQSRVVRSIPVYILKVGPILVHRWFKAWEKSS